MTPPNAPTAAERAGEERLAALAKLKADWNSYGSPPIDQRAIDSARRVIAATSHPPAIVPTNAGGIQLEWHREGVEVEITIQPEGGTEFYADNESLAARRENETLREIIRRVVAWDDAYQIGISTTSVADIIDDARAALAVTETRDAR